MCQLFFFVLFVEVKNFLIKCYDLYSTFKADIIENLIERKYSDHNFIIVMIIEIYMKLELTHPRRIRKYFPLSLKVPLMFFSSHCL